MALRVPTSNQGLQIRFWGVRGSTCASGPEFTRFGGHTPCIEIRCGSRLFVVDAGTGITALGASLGAPPPAEIDILFSHLHLDHVSGLPFFHPALCGESQVIRTYCGHLNGDSGAEAFGHLFAPPIFPVPLDKFPTRFEHHGFKAGETLTFSPGVTVATHALNHPGGATGFRFDHAGRSVCYLSDMEHSDPWPDPGLASFVRGADLVIYDGMFSEDEYRSCRGWGHSTWEKGVELCRAADVKALAIFHLYPGHTDDHLDGVEARMKQAMPSAFIARERQSIALAPLAEETSGTILKAVQAPAA